MTDAALVFASAAATASFSGDGAVFSACLFCVSCALFSLAKRRLRALRALYIAGAVLYLYHIYLAYGTAACAAFAVFSVFACIAGADGVKGAGNILFFVTIPLLVLMPFFWGDELPAAPLYCLPFAFISGACAAQTSRRGAACAVISSGVGAGIGAALRFCGGICAELYMYSAAFYAVLLFAGGIITRAKRS